MAESNVQIVQALYDAFASGDMGALSAILSNVEWHEATGMPYGGVYHGFDEVAANVFGPIAADVEGFNAKPDELLALGDDRAIALGSYRGTAGGADVNVPFGHIWTIRDGQIVKFFQFTDTHLFRQQAGK